MYYSVDKWLRNQCLNVKTKINKAKGKNINQLPYLLLDRHFVFTNKTQYKEWYFRISLSSQK